MSQRPKSTAYQHVQKEMMIKEEEEEEEEQQQQQQQQQEEQQQEEEEEEQEEEEEEEQGEETIEDEAIEKEEEVENENIDMDNNENDGENPQEEDEEEAIDLTEIKEEHLEEHDRKIIQLYEIVSELIEEQKARTQDLYMLIKGKNVEEVMKTVEERNDSLLQSLQTEFDLQKSENQENLEDEEVDAQFELYNEVVKAFNEYLEAMGDFTTSIQEQKQRNGEKNTSEEEEENQQLQNLLSEQTVILKEHMKKNNDLQNVLQTVLAEYSNKINLSNNRIKDLNEKMSQQGVVHQKQLQDLKIAYEKELQNLKKTKDEIYKKEIHELVQTLSEVRNQFREQIEELTKQMQSNQKNHEIQVLQLSGTIQELTTDLQDATTSISRLARMNTDLVKRGKTFYEKEWNRQKVREYQEICESLVLVRSEPDVDDEDEKPNSSIKTSSNDNTNIINPSRHAYRNSNKLPEESATQYFRRRDDSNASASVSEYSNLPKQHSRTDSDVSTASSISLQSGGKYYKRGDPLPPNMQNSGGNTNTSNTTSIHTDTTVGSSVFGKASSKNRRKNDRMRDLNTIGQVEPIYTKSLKSLPTFESEQQEEEYSIGHNSNHNGSIRNGVKSVPKDGVNQQDQDKERSIKNNNVPQYNNNIEEEEEDDSHNIHRSQTQPNTSAYRHKRNGTYELKNRTATTNTNGGGSTLPNTTKNINNGNANNVSTNQMNTNANTNNNNKYTNNNNNSGMNMTNGNKNSPVAVTERTSPINNNNVGNKTINNINNSNSNTNYGEITAQRMGNGTPPGSTVLAKYKQLKKENKLPNGNMKNNSQIHGNYDIDS